VPAIYYGQAATQKVMNARDLENELTGIRNVDEVVIDRNSVLAIKRGDLAII
jgi:hypothetical protein